MTDRTAPTSGDERPANRLAGETSPYLLQHARNPVDWYPWGEEALARARELDRPILLSIGYAACHWCHVMERESFENAKTAEQMNDRFVCIKVDREERPDLDDIYMAATIALTGSGGWPMTVFLTPAGDPFFAGTYFPPRDMMGRPGFPRLLELIADAWRGERAEVVEQAGRLAAHVAHQIGEPSPGPLSFELIPRAVDGLRRAFDSKWGGFGGAPKFPAPQSLELLLRHHRRSGDAHALRMATTTLDAMAHGGIFDALGGGFARYSTDEKWLVPHFEKMLYDNAQLARIYAEAFVVTGRPLYAEVARATLDYLLREMQSPEGGFYSSTDADSEGVEGKYFVWTAEQIEALLEPTDARALCAAYGVTPEGNWEGVSILHRPRPWTDVAAELDCSIEELDTRLARGREALARARGGRVPPACDDKILASWNGLAIGALAEAGRLLGEPRYLEAARRAADFVLTVMRRPDGSLGHSYRAGRARDESFLEDYGFVADALLDLAEAVGEPGAGPLRDAALGLAERMVADFADDQEGGGFYATPRGQDTPVVRAREALGGPLPSPTAVAARVLARLSHLTGREPFRTLAEQALTAQGAPMARMPLASASALGTLDLLLEGPVEVVLVGSPGEPAYEALERELARHYLPNRLIVHHDPKGGGAAPAPVAASLVAAKGLVEGRPAAYVCRGARCLPPVTSADAFGRQLRAETGDTG